MRSISTDLWSSAVVLVGLVLVRVAQALHLHWLTHADAVAAIIVAGIVVKVGWEMARRNVDELLDRASPDLRDAIARAVVVPGVRGVPQLRMRRSGSADFVDLTLAVDRGTPLERAHDIAQTAEDAVRAHLPRADVVVHIEPVPGQHEGILDLVRLHASRDGFAAHDVRIHDFGGRLSIDLHLEAAEALSLQEADRRARDFESSLRQAIPNLESLVSHLEPAGETPGSPQPVPAATVDRIQTALRFISSELGTPFDAHALRVKMVDRKLAASFHCVVRDDTTLQEAHRLSEDVERRLRQRLPEVGRVTIRMEPPGAGCPEDATGPSTPLRPTRAHPRSTPAGK